MPLQRGRNIQTWTNGAIPETNGTCLRGPGFLRTLDMGGDQQQTRDEGTGGAGWRRNVWVARQEMRLLQKDKGRSRALREGERLWRRENHWARLKRAKRKGPCLSTSSRFLHFWYSALKHAADIMTGRSSQLTHWSLWLVTKGLCLHFWKVSL